MSEVCRKNVAIAIWDIFYLWQSLRLQRSCFQDPILFSHFPASAKIASDLKLRSDHKNKIAGASGILAHAVATFLWQPCPVHARGKLWVFCLLNFGDRDRGGVKSRGGGGILNFQGP